MSWDAIDGDDVFTGSQVMDVGLKAVDGGIEKVVDDEGVSWDVDDDEQLPSLALERSGMFSCHFNNDHPQKHLG